jgi:hypothetical protein
VVRCPDVVDDLVYGLGSFEVPRRHKDHQSHFCVDAAALEHLVLLNPEQHFIGFVLEFPLVEVQSVGHITYFLHTLLHVFVHCQHFRVVVAVEFFDAFAFPVNNRI